MKVLPPLTITDAMLTTNIPEPDTGEGDPAVWSSGTTYAADDEVSVASTHKIYVSVQAGNTNHDPTTDDGTWWIEKQATNAWAMFDQSRSTQSIQADEIDVTIDPGQIVNGVALINVYALTVQVIVDDPVEGEVYNETVSLIADSGITDWYAYYFTPIERTTDIAFLDLPAYGSATVQVILAESGEDVLCGALVVGSQVNVGITNYGTTTGIINYDRKTTDSFGNVNIVPVGFSRRADYDITVETGKTNAIQNFLASTRGSAVVWVGNNDYAATVVYGFFKDFSILLSEYQISECNIQVEGLV